MSGLNTFDEPAAVLAAVPSASAPAAAASGTAGAGRLAFDGGEAHFERGQTGFEVFEIIDAERAARQPALSRRLCRCRPPNAVRRQHEYRHRSADQYRGRARRETALSCRTHPTGANRDAPARCRSEKRRRPAG
jgi:hypothetical protein